jgi:hypothetical protein
MKQKVDNIGKQELLFALENKSQRDQQEKSRRLFSGSNSNAEVNKVTNDRIY